MCSYVLCLPAHSTSQHLVLLVLPAALAVACPGVPVPAVVINEVDCHGRDRVELAGPPGSDIAGLEVGASGGTFTLPRGTVVGPDGWAVIEHGSASGILFDVGCDTGSLTLSFDGEPLDRASFPPFPGSFDGTTLCRLPDVSGPFGLCAPSIGATNSAFVDPGPVLFDPRSVARIDLALDDAALEALTNAPRDYVAGAFTVTAGGVTHGPTSAGIALKGNEAGSFRQLTGKAAFKVKFTAFGGERLLGLKGLKLNNMIEDPSHVHEAVGYAFFAQLDVPAARAGYARVFVNGADYGLHSTIERVDDVWSSRHFADTQHVYEGGVLGVDAVPCDPTCVPAGSLSCTCVDDIETESGDESDRADLDALASVSLASDDAFLAALTDHVDIERSARSWMGAQYLYHWDGYAGGRNNYYLHSDARSTFTFIPSGLDQALDPAAVGLDASYDLHSGTSPFAPQGAVFNRCRAIAACTVLLNDAVDEMTIAVAAFDAAALLDDVVVVIEEAVAADARKEVTLAEVHAAQEVSRQLLIDREATLGSLAR